MHAFPEPFSVAWTKVILVSPQWSNKMQFEIDLQYCIINIMVVTVKVVLVRVMMMIRFCKHDIYDMVTSKCHKFQA